LLPFGHPRPPRPDSRDRSGGALVAAPGPVCPSDSEAVDTVGPCDRPPDPGWSRSPGGRGSVVTVNGVVSVMDTGGLAGRGSPFGG